jgi:hypothetical protein
MAEREKWSCEKCKTGRFLKLQFIQGIPKEWLSVTTSFPSCLQQCTEWHCGGHLQHHTQTVINEHEFSQTYNVSTAVNTIFTLCLKVLLYFKNCQVFLAHFV